MEKVIFAIVLLSNTQTIVGAAMSGNPFAAAALKQVCEAIPAHIHGPERAMMIDKMLKGYVPQWTDSIGYVQINGCNSWTNWNQHLYHPDWPSDRITFHAIRLKIKNRTTWWDQLSWNNMSGVAGVATSLPDIFFEKLPVSLIHYLDVSDLTSLDKPTLEKLEKAWLESGRKKENLKLPKPSSCVIQ